MACWNVRAEGGRHSPDLAEVRKALGHFADPEHWVELRGLPSGRSRVCKGSDLDSLCRGADELSDGTGVYWMLNPVKTDIGHKAATWKEIAYRRWLLIDTDPVKPDEFKDDSATDDEKEGARAVAAQIMASLTRRGWPAPVVVDSGNGWHMLYRIDLPVTQHSQVLLRTFLRALGKEFGSAKGKVDLAVHNAARISKLPGTWARKGRLLPDRPWRMCRLVHVPDEMVVVEPELISTVAGTKATAETEVPAQTRHNSFTARATSGSSSGAEAYGSVALDAEVAAVKLAPKGQRNDQLNRSAFSLGQLVAGGVLDRSQVEEALREAARLAGLYDDPGCGERGVQATLQSGLEAGMKEPRGVPERKPQPSANGDAKKEEGRPDRGKDSEAVIVRASAIQPRKVGWLWPGRVPLGKLTTFAGAGGLGKTFVLCDLASRVSRGLAWPDLPDEHCSPAQVLFVSGEDDPDDTLVPRLIELGADLDRVVFLTTETLDRFTLADLDTLDAALTQAGDGVRFIAIDPPTAYLGGVDDHKNAELRGLLAPLKNWAAKHRVAVVFNTHVNKPQGAKVEAMMRVMGSVAWVNAVRAAHMFARDPDDPERRLFVPMKSNLGKERKGLAYRIVESNDLAKIEWLGEVDTTADEALSRDKKQPRRVVASEWLIERFREKREWPSDDLFRAARQEGVSRDAIFEAKKELDLPRARRVVGPDGSITYFWWVPDGWPPLSVHCDTCDSCDSKTEVEF